MKVKIKHILFVLPLCLSAAMSGCVKEKLTTRPDDGLIVLHLDWDGNPREANVYIYEESGALYRLSANVSETLEERVTAGRYNIVAHNTDAVNVDMRGTDRYETAEVFATGTGRAAGTIIPQPDAVFAAGSSSGLITFDVKRGKTTELSTTPERLSRSVTMKIKVTGADDILSISGYLNGVCESVFMATGQPNYSPGFSIAYTAQPSNIANIFTVNLTTFGLLAQEQSGVTVIDVKLVDGDNTAYDISEDISQAIRDVISENGGIVPVEIPLDITISFGHLGFSGVVVKPWDIGSEDEIEIQNPA